MPKFISADRLLVAVTNLRESRASGGMVNFLILKRSLVLANRDEIALSTRDRSFQQAITELTSWSDADETTLDTPFLDVFGSANAGTLGLRKRKYRSNGPADTLKNGAWSGVVQVTDGAQSKTAKLKAGYLDHLQRQVLLKDDNRQMPLLADTAVWYFRRQDVSKIVGRETDNEKIEELLSDAFIKLLALTEEELTCLYGDHEEEEEDAE